MPATRSKEKTVIYYRKHRSYFYTYEIRCALQKILITKNLNYSMHKNVDFMILRGIVLKIRQLRAKCVANFDA